MITKFHQWIPRFDMKGYLFHMMVQKCLIGGALYLSKISGAEIVILHVLEHVENILRETKEEVSLTTEGYMRQLLEERIKLCKKAGVKEVSYIIRAGRPADQIVSLVRERYYDLIVMASSRISSTIRIILGSNAKKVLDSVAKPILVIR